MTKKYIIALDQGTSSSRTILYSLDGKEVCSTAIEYNLQYPQNAWVEVDANEIIRTQFKTLETVINKISPSEVIALGITNQRETIVAWHRYTKKALAPAIIWQCRRSASFCEQLKNVKNENSQQKNYSDIIKNKTGLTIDAYFSASKIKWLIENNDDVKKYLPLNEVVFGTVDSWLMANLLEGENYYTDSSNASRTMLYNLHTNSWDDELLDIFSVPKNSLCKILPSNSNFGIAKIYNINAPIHAVLGDQQSSLFGNKCFAKNESKCTFGTGAFILKNSGNKIEATSKESGLLSTVAWSLKKGSTVELTYAIEGSIFIAGSLIKWLRDSLKLFSSAQELDLLAEEVGGSNGVFIVPAFVGLGSPHWNQSARASIQGISAGTTKSHIAYAALEAIAHSVADLLELPEYEQINEIKIDGGLVNSKIFRQILANITQRKIVISENIESTAYGIFLMLSKELNIFEEDSKDNNFQPSYFSVIEKQILNNQRAFWKKAVERSLDWV